MIKKVVIVVLLLTVVGAVSIGYFQGGDFLNDDSNETDLEPLTPDGEGNENQDDTEGNDDSESSVDFAPDTLNNYMFNKGTDIALDKYTSFTVSIERTYQGEGYGGTTTEVYRFDTENEVGSRQISYVPQNESGSAAGTENFRYSEPNVTVEKFVNGTDVSYRKSLAPHTDGPVPLSENRFPRMSLFTQHINSTSFVEYDNRHGQRVGVYEISEDSLDSNDYYGNTILSLSGTYEITNQRGVIYTDESLTYEIDASDDNQVVTSEQKIEISDFNSTDVERPEWYDAALES
jgi:hypothetical protein